MVLCSCWTRGGDWGAQRGKEQEDTGEAGKVPVDRHGHFAPEALKRAW